MAVQTVTLRKIISCIAVLAPQNSSPFFMIAALCYLHQGDVLLAHYSGRCYWTGKNVEVKFRVKGREREAETFLYRLYKEPKKLI